MQQHGFTYRGRNVSVPWSADIPYDYRFGGNGAWATREALERIVTWPRGHDLIETVRLSRPVPRMVLSTDGEPVKWGNHRGHKAKHVQASPFIVTDHTVRTRLFTIELTGTSQSPTLVRAYSGDYVPPLPWMNSAEQAQGGIEFCVEFWRTHAYIYRYTLVDNLSDRAPSWFH